MFDRQQEEWATPVGVECGVGKARCVGWINPRYIGRF